MLQYTVGSVLIGPLALVFDLWADRIAIKHSTPALATLARRLCGIKQDGSHQRQSIVWNEAQTWGIIWDKMEGLLDQVSVKNILLVLITTESYTKSTVSVCLQRIKSNQSHRSPIRYTSHHISKKNTATTPDPPYPTILTCSHVFQLDFWGFSQVR